MWAQKFSSKQYLTAGSLLGTIVPDIHRTKIMAYAKIPSTDLVGVYNGVEVQLMPQIYPLLDYGFISGKVSQVSLLPLKVQKDSKAGSADYIITIVIDTSLISSTGQKMEYKPKMVANIKIFTKNRSILTKIFEPTIKLLNSINNLAGQNSSILVHCILNRYFSCAVSIKQIFHEIEK